MTAELQRYKCTTCPNGLCPKIKGIAGEYGGLDEAGLDIVTFTTKTLCHGQVSPKGDKCPTQKAPPASAFLGASVYHAAYTAVGHFRNDGANPAGSASTPFIWLHHGSQVAACDGFHISQNLALDLQDQINHALTTSGGDRFCIRNHENGCRCPAEYWTRAGITDLRNGITAALDAWPSS